MVVVRPLIIIQALLDLILNMEDMDHLRSLVVVLLSLVQDREVIDSPSLEVVHLPFPVETEYRSLTVTLLLSPVVDTLDLLHTLVDIILPLDHLHTVAVNIMHTLHTVAADTMHTAVVDILHHLQGSLTRTATEVPVILNSQEAVEVILRHGLGTQTVITLPILVADGEAKIVTRSLSKVYCMYST